MAFWDRYQQEAPQYESETPSETVPEGKYPGEIINASLRHVEGTSDKGAYSFADAGIQLKILEGPLKGQTVWVNRMNNLGYDPSGDAATDKRRLYFTQHFYDATGLGKKMDPAWTRTERPHPTKPGKTQVVFKGFVLSKDQLVNIAKDEQETEQFINTLKGLKGIWRLKIREFETDAGPGEAQSFGGVEAYTDANLMKWRRDNEGGAGEGAPSPSSSPYATA